MSSPVHVEPSGGPLGTLMFRQVRSVAILGGLLASGVAGVWIGEDLTAWTIRPLLLCFLAPGLVAATRVAGPRRLHRVLWGMLAIAVFAGGWWTGRSGARRAYNACLTDGALALQALDSYRLATGRYPNKLHEATSSPPCRRLLRGTLLQYSRNDDGFRLSFSDWLVTHGARERDVAFVVQK